MVQRIRGEFNNLKPTVKKLNSKITLLFHYLPKINKKLAIYFVPEMFKILMMQ